MKKFLTLVAALIVSATLSAGAEEVNWKARWLTKEHITVGANCWMAFRTVVNLDNVPETVTARIATDTKYWLWINGELVVYEGGLKRGPAPMATYYDKVEIAPWLKKGENLIAVAVWHMGKNGFSHIDSGNLALLFQAEGDGVGIYSQNDGSWESSQLLAYGTADTPEPNYRFPESNVRYDARVYAETDGEENRHCPEDWYKSQGDDSIGGVMEMPYNPGEGPFGKLVERPIPQWKNYGVRNYESVEHRGDTLVCTMPYNLHASPVLKVNAPAGQLITMFTDHVKVGSSQGLSAQYVTKDGVQEYEHLCWMNGEKMYYVIPEGVEVMEVKYRETGYDCELSGKWKSDDPILNQYWDKAARSLYVCMRDTYCDCPDRERGQWLGDEVNELGMAFYQLSPSAADLAVKGMKEVASWAKPDGGLYGPVPAGNWYRELPMQSLAFIGWYGARRLAFYSGDYAFVKDIYPAFRRYLHETIKLDEDKLPVYRRGTEVWDWPDVGSGCDAKAQFVLWYYLALKAEQEFAVKLGKTQDAAADEALLTSIAKAYNDKFWNGSEYRNPERKRAADSRVQALAVVSGIASADKYPAILKLLAQEDRASTYFHCYILEALCMMGHPEMAQDYMLRRYPTIMKDDCSSLYELWDHESSCNHAWSGAGSVIMMEYFAGVKPKEPGFKSFTVEPQMGNLKHIETSFETRYGMVRLKLDKGRGKKITAEIEVPEGSTAELHSASGKVYNVGEGVHKVIL